MLTFDLRLIPSWKMIRCTPLFSNRYLYHQNPEDFWDRKEYVYQITIETWMKTLSDTWCSCVRFASSCSRQHLVNSKVCNFVHRCVARSPLPLEGSLSVWTTTIVGLVKIQDMTGPIQDSFAYFRLMFFIVKSSNSRACGFSISYHCFARMWVFLDIDDHASDLMSSGLDKIWIFVNRPFTKNTPLNRHVPNSEAPVNRLQLSKRIFHHEFSKHCP